MTDVVRTCGYAPCTEAVPADQLFCDKHWRSLSRKTRRRIWRATHLRGTTGAVDAAMELASIEIRRNGKECLDGT